MLEENGGASRIAVLSAEDLSTYRLQNGKPQLEQTLSISHAKPWPLDLRGRLIPGADHTLSAYMPGLVCRITFSSAPSNITCQAGDDPWPIVTPAIGLASPVFPSAGGGTTSPAPVAPLAGFFASTRNYFTGVLSPAIGGPGDQAQDSIRTYEFPDRDPVAVSAALDFPGPISALWTETRADTAIAIARDRDTGNYEAFRLSLSCGQ